MALEARKAIARSLKSGGAKTREQLSREYLGEVPDDPQEKQAYKTKYQGFYRAIESMVQDGTLEQPKYRLTGELANQSDITKSMKRFVESNEPLRQKIHMEDIEAECRKREAIQTPRILLFLKARLDSESEDVRKLAVSSISYMSSKMDESRREDTRLLKRLRTDYSQRLADMAKNDKSREIRRGTFEVLLILGVPSTISVLEYWVNQFPPKEFREIKSTLFNDLFRPYDESAYLKNRVLRDYKDELRNMLMETRLRSKDKLVQERAEVLMWKLRHGWGNILPGGREENLE